MALTFWQQWFEILLQCGRLSRIRSVYKLKDSIILRSYILLFKNYLIYFAILNLKACSSFLSFCLLSLLSLVNYFMCFFLCASHSNCSFSFNVSSLWQAAVVLSQLLRLSPLMLSLIDYACTQLSSAHCSLMCHIAFVAPGPGICCCRCCGEYCWFI